MGKVLTGNSPKFEIPGFLTVSLVAGLVFILARRLEHLLLRAYHPNEYLWIHILIEIFSIAVAYTVWSTVWFQPGRHTTRRPFWLGIAFLAICIVEAFHTVTYEGMPDFFISPSPEASVYFWLISRIISGIAFLAATRLDYRPVGKAERWLGMIGALLVSGLVVSIAVYRANWLPLLYVEGHGLTPLKKGTEWFVILLMMTAAFSYAYEWRNRKDLLSYYLALSLIVSVFTGISFTLYRSVYDGYNLLGHGYKALSYVFIYYGLFVLLIRKPYQELNEAYLRLRRTQRLSLLGQMSANLAHETKNFLAVIKGCAQLGGLVAEKERAARLFAQIEKAAGELNSLASEAGQLSPGQNPGASNLAPLDIGRLVENTADLWKTQITETNITIVCRCEQKLPPVRGNPRLLRQALINLLSNATHALQPKGGVIRVTAEKRDSPGNPDCICISVEDNGAGIPQEVQKRLFEEFFTTKPEGTGLGLHITKEIVETIHGGRITFESKPGQGTVFHIILPSEDSPVSESA